MCIKDNIDIVLNEFVKYDLLVYVTLQNLK